MTPKKALAIRLPEELHQQIRELAARDQRSMNYVVVEALLKQLQAKPGKSSPTPATPTQAEPTTNSSSPISSGSSEKLFHGMNLEQYKTLRRKVNNGRADDTEKELWFRIKDDPWCPFQV